MNIQDFMKKHNLTDKDLDDLAKPYEEGTFGHEEGTVFSGSHIDAVGKRRITVIYNASDTQMVEKLAKTKGVKPSAIYRDALNQYLLHNAI